MNTYLRQVIGALIGEYDYVVIDSEAGIEQINRRVLERVTHLILVSDGSKKGMDVIRTVRRVADELVMYERCGAVLNPGAVIGRGAQVYPLVSVRGTVPANCIHKGGSVVEKR